jgi:hypothetical protein
MDQQQGPDRRTSQTLSNLPDARQRLANELHKQRRRNFPTRYVELKGLHDLVQADLVEMIPYAKFNRGFKYIMTLIDCFTKKAYAYPLKTKTANEVESVLAPFLNSNKFRNFQTDQGKEWFNERVGALFKKHNINHYATFTEKKASIVERFNRTLKSKMWKRFTVNGSYVWITILNELVNDYNNSVHSTTGLKPNEINQHNQQLVLDRIYGKIKKKRADLLQGKRFEIGDKVRISKQKAQFTKGYLPNWSNEIFTVVKVNKSLPITYVLQDSRGEIIRGSFYKEELARTKYPEIFLIEKIVRRKGNKVLVRWQGYDSSYDSWLNKNELM